MTLFIFESNYGQTSLRLRHYTYDIKRVPVVENVVTVIFVTRFCASHPQPKVISTITAWHVGCEAKSSASESI